MSNKEPKLTLKEFLVIGKLPVIKEISFEIFIKQGKQPNVTQDSILKLSEWENLATNFNK